MQIKRTPDEQFNNLADYPFEPNYLEVDDTEGGQLRIHYLDEGARDGEVVLLMHGQPAWSYLYRHMIPSLVEAGFRVVAPDLVGFGRSDEPEVAENKAAWEVLKQFDKPFMCAFADDDPVSAGGDRAFLDVVPGCSEVSHRTIGPAGHFLQQEQPDQCVQAILDITGR